MSNEMARYADLIARDFRKAAPDLTAGKWITVYWPPREEAVIVNVGGIPFVHEIGSDDDRWQFLEFHETKLDHPEYGEERICGGASVCFEFSEEIVKLMEGPYTERTRFCCRAGDIDAYFAKLRKNDPKKYEEVTTCDPDCTISAALDRPDEEDFNVMDWLSSENISAKFAAFLRQHGLGYANPWNGETLVYFDLTQFPEILKVTERIFFEYDSGTDSTTWPTWNEYELSSDGDVDYYAGTIEILIDCLRYFAANGDAENEIYLR